MSTSKQNMQPVRVSEILGHPRSSGKKCDSERKRMQPVRVAEILGTLDTSMKAGPSDRQSRRTFALPKQPVRRTLYTASPKVSPMPSKIVKPASMAITVPTMTFKNQKRRSFLPQPNSIAQRYVQKSTRTSTIIEERLSQIDEPPTGNLNHNQRPTVIKSAITTNVISETTLNSTITVTKDVVNDNDGKSVQDGDLDESIEDKENIPPVVEHHPQPLAENKARQFDNIDNLHLVGLLRSSISRMDKIESDIDTLKTLMQSQNNYLQSIELMLKMHINSSCKPISVPDVSSTPQILAEIPAPLPEDTHNANKENSSSENKKNRRKSKDYHQSERRRSARLAAQQTPDKKNSSFVELEKALNIEHSATKTAPSKTKTPKNLHKLIKPKSERPLREYLAMKGSLSILETPNGNNCFKKYSPTNDNTPARRKSLRRSISCKLLDELNDLYGDDTESLKTDEL